MTYRDNDRCLVCLDTITQLRGIMMELFADISTALALAVLTVGAIVLCRHITQLNYNSIYTYALVLRTALSVLCAAFWFKAIIQIW